MGELALFLPLRWWIRLIVIAVVGVSSVLQAGFRIMLVNFLWSSYIMFFLGAAFGLTFLFSGKQKKGR